MISLPHFHVQSLTETSQLLLRLHIKNQTPSSHHKALASTQPHQIPAKSLHFLTRLCLFTPHAGPVVFLKLDS